MKTEFNLLDFIKGEEFFDYLRDYQLFKKDSKAGTYFNTAIVIFAVNEIKLWTVHFGFVNKTTYLLRPKIIFIRFSLATLPFIQISKSESNEQCERCTNRRDPAGDRCCLYADHIFTRWTLDAYATYFTRKCTVSIMHTNNR